MRKWAKGKEGMEKKKKDETEEKESLKKLSHTSVKTRMIDGSQEVPDVLKNARSPNR